MRRELSLWDNAAFGNSVVEQGQGFFPRQHQFKFLTLMRAKSLFAGYAVFFAHGV